MSDASSRWSCAVRVAVLAQLLAGACGSPQPGDDGDAVESVALASSQLTATPAPAERESRAVAARSVDEQPPGERAQHLRAAIMAELSALATQRDVLAGLKANRGRGDVPPDEEAEADQQIAALEGRMQAREARLRALRDEAP